MDNLDHDSIARELIEGSEEATNLLKAIANEKRLIILCHLLDGEKSVGQLEEVLDLSQSALSQHLARLRVGKIVRTRRSAQTIYYSLSGNSGEALLAALHSVIAPSEGNGSERSQSPAA